MTITSTTLGRAFVDYDLVGSHRLAVSTGAVTVIAAKTATAGHVFAFRWPGTTAVKCYLKYVGARFIATTAYTTAQETGVDMILARSWTVSDTAATAVDVGSTVADTNNLDTIFATSLITANCVRVASTVALTAGTHTLDSNPIGVLSAWAGGTIGDTVPLVTAAPSNYAQGQFGTLWDYRESAHGVPIRFDQDEGFILRNHILMGAVGVGRWDFLVEWDEGTPSSAAG